MWALKYKHKSFDIMDGIETILYSPSLLNPKSFLKGPFLHGDATRQFEYHNFSLMSLSPLVWSVSIFLLLWLWWPSTTWSVVFFYPQKRATIFYMFLPLRAAPMHWIVHWEKNLSLRSDLITLRVLIRVVWGTGMAWGNFDMLIWLDQWTFQVN